MTFLLCAFDASSEDLFNVNVGDAFVVDVFLDLEGDRSNANSLTGQPAYSLLMGVSVHKAIAQDSPRGYQSKKGLEVIRELPIHDEVAIEIFECD